MSIFYTFYVEVGRHGKEKRIDILDWHGLSLAEWKALTEEQQEDLLEQIYDEVIGELMVSGWTKCEGGEG